MALRECFLSEYTRVVLLYEIRIAVAHKGVFDRDVRLSPGSEIIFGVFCAEPNLI